MNPVSQITILVFAVITSIAGAYAQSSAGDSRQLVEQNPEWKGQYGGSLDAGHQVVVDANGWARLWRSLGHDAPPLDFTKYFAVAVMAGERPTGGYTIEFLGLVPKETDVIMRYRIRKPTGYTTQAIAQPWKVRAFPRVEGRVRVEALTSEIAPK